MTMNNTKRIWSDHKVITITGPHGSGKDTLIMWALNNITGSKKVVSSTDRWLRVWEIPGYSYNFESKKPAEEDIFDGITIPVKNSLSGLLGVNYWIWNTYVRSLFEAENMSLWHTGPTVITKLKDKYADRVYSIYLHADYEVLIARLQSRDDMSEEQARTRLAHDPGNIDSVNNSQFDRKLFDNTIATTRSKEAVLSEFMELFVK
jgi:guanylate kinase